MLIAYKPSDRITLKIQGVEFKISPMTYEQKMKAQSSIVMSGGDKIENIAKATKAIVQMSVKEVKGIVFADGSDFECELVNGELSEDCVDALLNTSIHGELGASLMQMMTQISDKIYMPGTNDVMEGVEVILPKSKGVKRKK